MRPPFQRLLIPIALVLVLAGTFALSSHPPGHHTTVQASRVSDVAASTPDMTRAERDDLLTDAQQQAAEAKAAAEAEAQRLAAAKASALRASRGATRPRPRPPVQQQAAPAPAPQPVSVDFCTGWGAKTRAQSDNCWRHVVVTDENGVEHSVGVDAYNWPVDTMLRIMYCESHGNPWVVNNSNHVGLFQIHNSNTKGNGPANIAQAHDMWERSGTQPWTQCGG